MELFTIQAQKRALGGITQWGFCGVFRLKGTKGGKTEKTPRSLLLPIELSVTVIMLKPLKAQDIQSCVSARG